MDDDKKLFKEKEIKFNFSNPDDDSLNDPAVKELLEEIDRSFKGFEKVAKNNVWLGESGVNAETVLLNEAVCAREEGVRLSNVDLLQFVGNAISLDGGRIRKYGEILEIELPPLWNYGLDDLPGYDAQQRIIRITTNIDTILDEQGNTVGFLGRSHPLVKKAMDRVRSISFGVTGSSWIDHRATAVTGDDNISCLLLTFLCSITTKKKKLYEKVLAVKIDKNEHVQTFLSPEEWLKYADPAKAIRPTDMWDRYFLSWGDTAIETAKKNS